VCKMNLACIHFSTNAGRQYSYPPHTPDTINCPTMDDAEIVHQRPKDEMKQKELVKITAGLLLRDRGDPVWRHKWYKFMTEEEQCMLLDDMMERLKRRGLDGVVSDLESRYWKAEKEESLRIYSTIEEILKCSRDVCHGSGYIETDSGCVCGRVFTDTRKK